MSNQIIDKLHTEMRQLEDDIASGKFKNCESKLQDKLEEMSRTLATLPEEDHNNAVVLTIDRKINDLWMGDHQGGC